MERRVSHYRLVARLGGGGMGDVWRAVDDRLGREVAVKLLPAERAGEERQLRLLREAKAAGTLNHPNIITVHDVGVADDGQPYLVMELVEGLRFTELAAQKIEPQRALELCADVAEALAFAHGRGILHRDVKSDNLMVTANGRVKVLDFGLAKRLVEAGEPTPPPAPAPLPDDESLDEPHDPHAATVALGSGSSDSSRSSPTPRSSPSTQSDLTRHGDLLGTPDYMSPEQARGAPVDAKSEVFSLGVVLWELLVGRRPFTGRTIRETLERVRRAEVGRPSLEGRPVPRGVDELVLRALARDPDARYPDMASLGAALRRLTMPAARVPFLLGAGAAGAALATAFWVWGGGGIREAKPQGVAVVEVKRLTHEPGCEENPSYTPDGKLLVYDAASGQAYNLFALEVKTGQVRQLTTGTGWDFAGSVSPDGTEVAFLRRQGGPTEVHVVSMEGESAARPSRRVSLGPRYYGSLRPAWSRDGTAVWIGEREAIARFDLATNQVTERREMPAGFAAIKLAELWDGRLATVAVRVTPELAGPADGVGVFGADGQLTWLWRTPLDEALGIEPGGGALLVARVMEAGRHEMWRVPLDGGRPSAVRGHQVAAIQGFAFSPATRELAFSRCLSRRTPVTAVGDQARGTARLFPWVGGEWEDYAPAALPGSDEVLLLSDRAGPPGLWQVSPSGQTPPRAIAIPGVAPVAAAAAPDGETLAVSDDQAIWLAPRAGGPPRKVVDAVVARMLSFSAEGRALYFVSHRPEGRQAFSVSLDGGTPIPVGEGMAVLATPSPTSGAVVWLGRVKGADGRVPLVFEENGRRRTLATFPDVEGVLGLAFHPEGVKLAVVTAEDVQELDVRDGTLLRRIPAGGDSFMGAVYAGGELVIDRSSYAGDLWVARVE